MHRRTARGNRLGLAVTGLILLVAGVALFLAHQGTFAAGSKRDVLYPAQARRFVHANTSWLWPVAAAVAIIVGLLFLRWLLVQTRSDRLRRVVIDTDSDADPAAGRTRMDPHALTDIVEDDISALDGVRSASASLSGHADLPQLWLRVSTDADADVARIHHAITTGVIADARACLELPRLPTYLQLTVSRRKR